MAHLNASIGSSIVLRVVAESPPGFRLLGAVELSGVAGTAPTFARAQHRDLLALLLLHAERLVSVEQVVEDLWAGRAPGTATTQVQNMISALRVVLRGAAVPALIESRRGCYALRTDRNEIDVDRFNTLLARARDGGADAGGQARAALALWRGQPLADVRAPFAERARAVLAEQRAQAHELLFAAELAAGRHSEIIPELATLAAEFPQRERLLVQWLTALHLSGRRVEALAAYRDAVRVLRHDYGLEPTATLRELELRMLRGDADPNPQTSSTSTTPAGRTRVMQLPGDVGGFVGRAEELAALDALLAADPATPVAAVLTGTAGVGKTALALHWAHRVADHFPDGQLYIDLRGYDPRQPVATEQAIAVLLRGLGVETRSLPDDLNERAATYRSELAGRRVLVLLDNAASTEQVRALMPGDGAGITVVTSRDSLTGLVARYGARRIALDLLPAGQAADLLGTLVGERVRASPQAAAALAAHCAFLPLALRVAAEYLAARPSMDLDAVVAQLADYRQRLDLLDADGDERTGVHSVLSWSYRHLPEEPALAFRRLGRHPGYSLTPEVLGALIDADPARAAELLRTLHRAHLVQQLSPQRYQMHDLLRAYAQRVASQESTVDAEAASARLLSYYLSGLAGAMDQLFPYEAHRRPVPPAGSYPFPDTASALAWLDAERENLLALALATPSAISDLSRLLWRYYDAGFHLDDAALVHTAALTDARERGDRIAEGQALMFLGARHSRRGEGREYYDLVSEALALFIAAGDQAGAAEAHRSLAVAAYQLGEPERSLEHTQLSMQLYRAVGDMAGLGVMIGHLGVTYAQQGRFPEALEQFHQGLELSRTAGNQAGVGRSLVNIGEVYAHWDRLDEAIQWQTQALQHFQRIGDRSAQAGVLRHLGDVHRRGGRYAEAVAHHRQSLEVSRELHDRQGEAESLDRLGSAYAQWGRPAEAVQAQQEALAAAIETGLRNLELSARNGLGESLAGIGRHAEAAAEYSAALELADATGDRYAHAKARDGLGRCALAAGDAALAASHWRAAQSEYAELGLPEAEAVAQRLAGLDGSNAGPA
jgi:DNA-binding SARP family transcriptional activator